MDEENNVTVKDVKNGARHSDTHDVSITQADVFIDPELEKRVMRKFDRFVLPQFAILVLIAYLDRSNIGRFNCTLKPPLPSL
jgi:hypothetical protein